MLLIVPLQKGHVYNLRSFSGVTVSTVAAGGFLNPARPRVLLVALSALRPSLSVADSVALTRWAIAAHVSRRICFFHSLLRSGFNRTIVAVAAVADYSLYSFCAARVAHLFAIFS